MKEEVFTAEMAEFFEKRTATHISLVKKWYDKLIHEYCSIPMVQIEYHDKSKYESPEYEPYISLTWSYHCKDNNTAFNISDELQEEIRQATLHHITNNKHHPEYWDLNFDPAMLNSRDRDKPSNKMVDATQMPLPYILEMMADWLAMSEEKQTDIYEWAEKNVNVRWHFTPEQINLIESVIDTFAEDYSK